jgi:hypothetical protein
MIVGGEPHILKVPAQGRNLPRNAAQARNEIAAAQELRLIVAVLSAQVSAEGEDNNVDEINRRRPRRHRAVCDSCVCAKPDRYHRQVANRGNHRDDDIHDGVG